jgi:ABC transporter DrrB family efflux protein
MSAVQYAVSDTFVLALRNLRRIPRAPDLLISFTLQPIMFVLLFVYVFGGAIETPGHEYVDFVIPGLIAQTMFFGGFVTAIGLADDLKKGLIDRFRSLPTARGSVLAGRTLADVATNLLSLVIMVSVGLIIGFSFDASPLEIVAGFGLMLLFGYAFSWIFALFALISSSAESAQAMGFMIIFPLTFISSAFVPIDTLPDGLRQFAEVNPFTVAVDALRALWIGDPAGNSIWGAVVWSIGLSVLFALVCVRRYKRAVSA